MNNKICVVNNDLTYFNLHRKKFINIIDKKNNEITLLFPSIFNSDEYKKSITYLENEGYRIKYFFLKRKSINFFLELWTLFSLFLNLRNDYKTIYSSTVKLNLHLIFISLFKKSKIILHFSGLGFFYVNNSIIFKFIRLIIELTFKHLKKNSTFCIFENLDDFDYFTKSKKIFKINNCLHIRGVGVDVNRFKKVQKKHYQFTVLMVSRITEEKGVNDFLNCYSLFSQDNRFKFILIGQYEKSKKNEILINKINIFKKNKNFEYYKWRSDIKKFYDIANVSVLPSYREGLSVFLLESLASGLPVICSNVIGNKNLVKNDYNGYLVNINSPNEIRDSIMLLFQNKNKYNELSLNSRKLSEELYNENIILQNFSKFLRENKIL